MGLLKEGDTGDYMDEIGKEFGELEKEFDELSELLNRIPGLYNACKRVGWEAERYEKACSESLIFPHWSFAANPKGVWNLGRLFDIEKVRGELEWRVWIKHSSTLDMSSIVVHQVHTSFLDGFMTWGEIGIEWGSIEQMITSLRVSRRDVEELLGESEDQWPFKGESLAKVLDFGIGELIKGYEDLSLEELLTNERESVRELGKFIRRKLHVSE